MNKEISTKGMQVVGRGLFTICYRKSETRVLLKSVCCFKELLSMGWITSTWFPKINHIYNVQYEMKYYEKVTAPKKQLKKEHYFLYRQLLQIYHKCWKLPNKDNNVSDYIKAFESVSNKSLRHALQEACKHMENYDSNIGFEISPRNIAVQNKKLVLLDCFFFPRHAEKVRKLKAKNLDIFKIL